MPLYNNYAGKAVPGSPYRVDGRATFKMPLKPLSTNVGDGPTTNMASGVRLNYPSGTDN